MNSEGLCHGRPFGGCSVLFNSALSHCIYCIDLNCKHLCCIKLRTPSYKSYVFNVYLPCDTNKYDYNEVDCQLFLTIVETIRLHIAFLSDTDFTR